MPGTIDRVTFYISSLDKIKNDLAGLESDLSEDLEYLQNLDDVFVHSRGLTRDGLKEINKTLVQISGCASQIVGHTIAFLSTAMEEFESADSAAAVWLMRFVEAKGGQGCLGG